MTTASTPTLREQGFRMPAEWEPHEATWLSWPHNDDSWPGKFDRVPPVFAQMTAAIAASEPVYINVTDSEMEANACRALDAAQAGGEIHFHHFPTNDAWCRDHGAIILVHADGRRHALDWRYNAWGEKYPPFDRDDVIAPNMAAALGMECTSLPWVLEGGSIDVNGTGCVLTTESCLLNPNRNPSLSREQIEQMLCDNLGVDTVVWLGDGIVGDDTDGHIDDITRFVAEDTVLTAVEENHEDDNYLALTQNLTLLKSARNNGQPFQVKTLPMPAPVIYEEQRLPASYANFYIANRAVLLPTYGCPQDDLAAEVLQACFPTRKVISIDCTDLVWGLGAFHCLTQQIPAALSPA